MQKDGKGFKESMADADRNFSEPPQGQISCAVLSPPGVQSVGLSYWLIRQHSTVHHLRAANGIIDFHLRAAGEEEKDFSTEFKGKK